MMIAEIQIQAIQKQLSLKLTGLQIYHFLELVVDRIWTKSRKRTEG